MKQPTLSNAGADTNISRGLEPKGSGMVTLHETTLKINADMLSALRAIIAVAKTETSFSMQTIKDCAHIAIKQATGKK